MASAATVSSSALTTADQGGIFTASMPGQGPLSAQSLLDVINGELDPNSPVPGGLSGVTIAGGEIFNPYSSTPDASMSQYWGKGDKTMPTEQLQSALQGPAWQTYNQIIQQYPDLAGKIYNPDVIAGAIANKGGASPDPESNLPAFQFELQNALLNQPAVVSARGGQYVDLTQAPGAQQLLQQGTSQAQANQNYMQKYGAPTSAWTGFTQGALNVVTDPIFLMAAAALTMGAAGAAAGGIGAVSDAAAGTGAFAGGALDTAGSLAPELAASGTAAGTAAGGDAGSAANFITPDELNPAPMTAPTAAATTPSAQQLGLNALKSAGVNAAGQEATTGKINPTSLLLSAAGGAATPYLGSQISQATGLSPGLSNLAAGAVVNPSISAIEGGNPTASLAGTVAGGGTNLAGTAAGLPSGVAGALGTLAGQQAGQAVGQATQPSQQAVQPQQTPSNMLSSPSARAAPTATPAASAQPMQTLGASNSIPAGRQTAINALSGQPSASSTQQQQATNPFSAGMNMFTPISYYTYGSNISPYSVMAGVPVYKKGGEVKTPSRGGAVWGAGGGQDDLIPAYLADGEYVMDSQVVSALGGGSSKHGAKLLDEMRKQVREHSRSAPVSKIPPTPKAPLEYLKQAKAHLEK